MMPLRLLLAILLASSPVSAAHHKAAAVELPTAAPRLPSPAVEVTNGPGLFATLPAALALAGVDAERPISAQAAAPDVAPERQATEAAHAFDGMHVDEVLDLMTDAGMSAALPGLSRFALVPAAARLLQRSHVDRPAPYRLIGRALMGVLEEAGVQTPQQRRSWFDSLRSALNPTPKGHGLSWSRADSGDYFVRSVAAGSPAHKAGILAGDVIQAVDDEPLRKKALADANTALAPNKTLRLTIARAEEGLSDVVLAPALFVDHDYDAIFSGVVDVFERAARALPSTAAPALLKAGLERMGASLDAYTEYLGAEEMKGFARRFEQRNYGGFGFVRQLGAMTVTGVMPGSPAERAGLAEGDTVLSIDGDPVAGLSGEQATSALTRAVGQTATFVIENPNGEHREIRMTAEAIEIPLAAGGMLAGDVGYISLVNFSHASVQKAHEVIVALRKQGARSLVVDLRYNPGGELGASADLASWFLPGGSRILEMRGPRGEKTYAQTQTDGPFLRMPVAVLLNRASASASEVFAAALRDYDRAIIVGEPSFGKGVGQQTHPFAPGHTMKMTTFRWHTPTGRNLVEGKGIAPDVPVSTPEQEFGPILRSLFAGRYAGKTPGLDDPAVSAAWKKLTGSP